MSANPVSISAHPDLKLWVATVPPDVPTTIMAVMGDWRAPELEKWHALPEQATYKFMHLASVNGQFAQVTSISGPWEPEIVSLLLNLKLRPIKKNGIDILIDDDIAPHEPIEGWKVKQWAVVKSVGPNLEQIHQDLITWQKGEFMVGTSMCWKVYDSLHIP